MPFEGVYPLDILVVVVPIAWRFYKYEVFSGNWRKIFSNFFSGIIFVFQLFGLAWIFLFFLKAGVWSLQMSLLFAGVSQTEHLKNILMILFVLVDYFVDKLRSHWNLKVNIKSIGEVSTLFLETFTNMILTAFLFAFLALIIFLCSGIVSGSISDLLA